MAFVYSGEGVAAAAAPVALETSEDRELMKSIEDRYNKVKTKLANRDPRDTPMKDAVDVMMILHAFHHRKNPPESFLLPGTFEIRHRDKSARPCVIVRTTGGALDIPAMRMPSDRPLFGLADPQPEPTRNTLAGMSYRGLSFSDEIGLSMNNIPKKAVTALMRQPAERCYKGVKYTTGGRRPVANRSAVAPIQRPTVRPYKGVRDTKRTGRVVENTIARVKPSSAQEPSRMSTRFRSTTGGACSTTEKNTVDPIEHSLIKPKPVATGKTGLKTDSSKPGRIVLKLTGPQTVKPTVQGVKRKRPVDGTTTDEGSVAKRTRGSPTADDRSSVDTQQTEQATQQPIQGEITIAALRASKPGSQQQMPEGLDMFQLQRPHQDSSQAGGGSTGTAASGRNMKNGTVLKKRKRAANSDDYEATEGQEPTKRARATPSNSTTITTKRSTRSQTGSSKAAAKADNGGNKATNKSTATNTITTNQPASSSSTTVPAAVTESAASAPAVPGTTANAPTAPAPTAISRQIRTRADPVRGENGFELAGPQHTFILGHDQTAQLTQHYTILENGVRVAKQYTWKGERGRTARAIDWNDVQEIRRLNGWLSQWLRRSCGTARLRGDMNDTKWSDEEIDWLRAYVARNGGCASRKAVAQEFNDHFRGRVFKRMDKGVEVAMPPRKDRGLEAVFTAMGRKGIRWPRK